MNYADYRFTLDVHNSVQSQVSLPVTRGDTARRLYISLRDCGKPFFLRDGSQAVFSATKPDGQELVNYCIISGNKTVLYEFTPNTANVAGVMNCAVHLYGANGRLIASPKFIMVIDERVIRDDITPSESEMTVIDKMMLDEADRATAEIEREEKESLRETSEAQREENEEARQEGESRREANEEKRALFETQRGRSEASRVIAESQRADAELQREENELEREEKAALLDDAIEHASSLEDGFSPLVDVAEIAGGHKVSITDAQGQESFNVLDGKDGERGDPGVHVGPEAPTDEDAVMWVDTTADEPGAEFVKYTAEQGLTDEQKAQARANIGAISTEDIPDTERSEAEDVEDGDSIVIVRDGAEMLLPADAVGGGAQSWDDLGRGGEAWETIFDKNIKGLSVGMNPFDSAYPDIPLIEGDTYRVTYGYDGTHDTVAVYDESMGGVYVQSKDKYITVVSGMGIANEHISYPDYQLTVEHKTVGINKIPAEYLHQADMAQNDAQAADYVKNRTHYSVKPSEVMLDISLPFTNGDTGYQSGALPLVAGQKYLVEYDGTPYEFYCYESVQQGIPVLIAGQKYPLLGVVTEEPIAIYTSAAMNVWGAMQTSWKSSENGTSHSIKIYNGAEEVHPLPKKFVGDAAPFVVNLYAPSSYLSFKCDKTPEELAEAYSLGRTIRARLNVDSGILRGEYFFDLVQKDIDGAYVFLGQMRLKDDITSKYDSAMVQVILTPNAAGTAFDGQSEIVHAPITPIPTAEDNGKILAVVNGAYKLVTLAELQG